MRTLIANLLCLSLVLSLQGCSDSADEEMIRGNMYSMREAIQNHDKDNFMIHVATDYRGFYHSNRAALERFVAEQLRTNKNIYIYMADIDIEINDGVANVIFYAGTAGGPDQVPERGQLFKVSTNWEQLSGHWQLSSAKWRPALTK